MKHNNYLLAVLVFVFGFLVGSIVNADLGFLRTSVIDFGTESKAALTGHFITPDEISEQVLSADVQYRIGEDGVVEEVK